MAGNELESLENSNGARENDKSSSSDDKIRAGDHEAGEFLSPKLNKRPKRCLATTLRARGRSSIHTADEAFRLKHSKRRPCPRDRETYRSADLSNIIS